MFKDVIVADNGAVDIDISEGLPAVNEVFALGVVGDCEVARAAFEGVGARAARQGCILSVGLQQVIACAAVDNTAVARNERVITRAARDCRIVFADQD